MTFSSSATSLPERWPSPIASFTWPDALAARGALVAQALQAPHAAFVARAARLDALADPDFLLRPELVELGVLDRLGGELRRLARLVGGEVAREGQQPAAVELDDARGDAVEEGAVVGDEQIAAG